MRLTVALLAALAAALLLVPESATAAVTPRWSRAKAEARLEARPMLAHRQVLSATCRGLGQSRIRQHTRRWHRFDCSVYHPDAFVTFVILTARGPSAYTFIVYGGLG